MANLEEFRIPQYEGCGIYAIVNSKKMSCYIGSSKNIKLRIPEKPRKIKAFQR